MVSNSEYCLICGDYVDQNPCDCGCLDDDPNCEGFVLKTKKDSNEVIGLVHYFCARTNPKTMENLC